MLLLDPVIRDTTVQVARTPLVLQSTVALRVTIALLTPLNLSHVPTVPT